MEKVIGLSANLFFLLLIGTLIVSSIGCSNAPVVTKVPPVKEVVKESPPPVDEYQSFMNDGIDRFTRGDHNEALSFFLKAKELRPREGDVHYWLFQAYKNTEKKITSRSNAYIEAQNVVALMPDSPRAKHAQDFLNNLEKMSAPPKIAKPTPKPQTTVYIVQKPIQQKPTIVQVPPSPPPFVDTTNTMNGVRVPSYNNAQAAAYKQRLEAEYREKQAERKAAQARLDAREKEERDHQRKWEEESYRAQMRALSGWDPQEKSQSIKIDHKVEHKYGE